MAAESALGMARKDSSRRIGLDLPRKMNTNPDGRFAAVVVAVMELEAVAESVAPVDQTVPSSHYLMCPSHHEGDHSQSTLSSREMTADIGFAGRKQKAFATCLT